MAVRKFTAENAHQAMQNVREAFGRDAIIISNKTTADGIEIVATDNLDDLQAENAEQEPVEPAPPAKVRRKKSVTSQPSDNSITEQLADMQNQHGNMREAQLRQEISDLQGAVQGLAATGSGAPGAQWAEVTLAGRLMGLGLGSSLVQQLVRQAKPVRKMDTAWKRTLKNIGKQLRYSQGNFTTEGGVYAFHGPAGSGKTTAVCKLAAQFLSENTVGKLAIVSAGSSSKLERGDGLLSAFSQLLHIPVHHAETPSELRQVLGGLRRKKLVLIDTPAFDVNKLLPFGESTSQIRSKRKTEHCLVVSACSQGSLLDHTFACLAESAVDSVLLTQVDQTRQIGNAVDSLLRSGLQLRYCSDSADVHTPLKHAADEVLMNQLAEVLPVTATSRVDSDILAQIDSGSVANWLEPAILV